MIKKIKILGVILITSLFIFPFFLFFFPSLNTKMVLAVCGLIAFFLDRMNGENLGFEKNLLSLSFCALGVSLCSFLSMTLNNTMDNSYLGYIISMLVWLFAAYFCVYLIKKVEGNVSVEIVGYYLMGVAIFQCTMAILLNKFPFLQNIFDIYIIGGWDMGVGLQNRLHGPGCGLDVGGGRLGAILIIISHLLFQSVKNKKSKYLYIFLLSAFLYIGVVGCMIGRTASVGMFIAIVYFCLSFIFKDKNENISLGPYIISTLIVLSLTVLMCVVLYNTNVEVKRLLRFGFEGFFNYFEYGVFETQSTNMLTGGMVFPDNIRTWIIGDGYMASGTQDPYYLGPSDYGFYMNTDAGYSRFLFYFGLVGLVTFILFFINVCRICMQKTEHGKFLFLAILSLHFLIWIKVSTDIFVAFAPFLCLPVNEKEPIKLV